MEQAEVNVGRSAGATQVRCDAVQPMGECRVGEIGCVAVGVDVVFAFCVCCCCEQR